MRTVEEIVKMINLLKLPFYYQNIRSKNGTEQGRQKINRRYNMLKEMITISNIELAWFGEGRLKSEEKM